MIAIAKTRIARMGNKLYDLGTANKSFLQVAMDLKKLKIKNWFFMLELNDISLININPYATNEDGHTSLSKDQVTRVVNECMINPWYYLREISRIVSPGGTSVPYLANRGNIAQAFCMYHSIDSWLCLPRQKGKTISAIAFHAWLYNFGTSNSQFIYINKDGENAKLNLQRLKDQIMLLPEYLQFIKYVDNEGSTTKAKQNATSIAHPVNGNSVVIKSKATSYESALSLARGMSSPLLFLDEVEFTNHIKTIIVNSVSTFEQSARIARANGAPSFRCLCCTPKGRKILLLNTI